LKNPGPDSIELDWPKNHHRLNWQPSACYSSGTIRIMSQQTSNSSPTKLECRFQKSESETSNTTVFGLIKNTYQHAIEFTARAPGMNGAPMLFGLTGFALGFSFAYSLLLDLPNAHDQFINIFGFAASFAFILTGLYSAAKGIRFELFLPEDQPTIFDRKNRKVYRVYQESFGGLIGLFRSWPMKAAEFDWDLIDAEHQAMVTTTGSSVTRYHSLIFNVRRSQSDPTIVETFAIGNGMVMGETTVPAVWEHIRRFMEDDGPHLPPGEEARQIVKPKTFWQCLFGSQPLGAAFQRLWRNHPFLTAAGVLFSPIVVPFMVLKGICSWLGYKTSFPIEWPATVRAAVGPKYAG
jgi:hypothetical protein